MAARAVLVFTLIVSLLAAAETPAAAQDDGLRIEATTTYRVVPEDFSIEVEIQYSITNQTPNRTEGFRIIQTFFSAILESIPIDAVDVAATRSNGAALDMSVVDDPEFEPGPDNPFQLWEIDLGPNLFYRQTRDLTVTYRLPDGAARDLDAWARVNPAFLAFFAFGRGDDGLATVRIEIPEGFEVETAAGYEEEGNRDGALRKLLDEDGFQRWEITELAEPYAWSAFVVGSDESGLVRSEFEVPGVGTFAVAAWPGDTEWVEFVTDTVQAVGPYLEAATGLEWPHDDPLQITETVIPSLAGYAGFYSEPSPGFADTRFDGIDALVEIGEDLNAEVLSHEISHAWFNRDFSPMRWLTEGFAEYYGYNAAQAAGIDRPERFPLPIPSHPEAVELLDWTRPLGPVGDEDYGELYGYSASFHVIDSLSKGTGEDGMRAVVDVLANGRNPYDTDLELSSTVDWRRALDAFEIAGGADSTVEIFQNWVIGDRFDDLLEDRRATLDAAADLDAHEAGWSIPVAIPHLLGSWDFADADELIADLDAFLDAQMEVAARADALGVELPGEAREAFEAIATFDEGVDAAAAIADEQVSALTELEDATVVLAEPRGFVQNVGLRGLDPDADLLAAIAAFEDAGYDEASELARSAVAQVEAAQERGTDQLVEWGLIGAGALLALILIVWLWVRRRRRVQTPVTGDEVAEEQTEADAEEQAEADAEEQSEASSVPKDPKIEELEPEPEDPSA